ncbi:hypothetical protein [Rubrivirga sp.]|uniref:hypothetical protein n=1 Tax=Rubrivirga sp. TaxID=1885344 RepID=UPI003C79332F
MQRFLLVSVAFLLATAGPIAQPAPAVDHLDLLLRFDDAYTGGRVLHKLTDLRVVFPDPDGGYSFAFLDASGSPVTSADAELGPIDPSSAFATLQLASRLTFDRPTEPGSYTLAVLHNGGVIGAIPYDLEVAASDDPFDTRESIRMEGPWRSTGVVRFDRDNGDSAHLEVDVWVRQDELGSEEFETELHRDGQKISGEGRGNTAYTPDVWRAVTLSFRYPDQSAVDRESLTDGSYRVVITSGGREIKAYRFEVEGGSVVAHPQSDLATQPRHDFRTPRTLEDDVFWIEVE